MSNLSDIVISILYSKPTSSNCNEFCKILLLRSQEVRNNANNNGEKAIGFLQYQRRVKNSVKYPR